MGARRDRNRRRRPARAGAGPCGAGLSGRAAGGDHALYARPDLLLGWTRANRPEEREFLLPDVGGRAEVGRLTGRGNTANLEAVLSLKPDLILDAGYVSGGTRRNLEWVTRNVLWSGRTANDERERLLLADAQTSGGLLVAGEIPGAPIIGELVPRGDHVLVVR